MRKKLISGKKQEQITLVTRMPYDEGQEVDGVQVSDLDLDSHEG
jgi:hypothetical protein